MSEVKALTPKELTEKWFPKRNVIRADFETDLRSVLRGELIKYDRIYWGLRGDSEKEVDEYLNNNQ
jgi:hypothetical protein